MKTACIFLSFTIAEQVFIYIYFLFSILDFL